MEKGLFHAPVKEIPGSDCMAAIIGYREDEETFNQALKSYLQAANCRFVLVGIDGDDNEDQYMFEIFQKVFPERSAMVHMDTPLVDLALELSASLPESQNKEDHIISLCVREARQHLERSKVSLHDVRYLCISQPHMHKKGIMFSSFIFSLLITEIYGLEWIWSSDSDTIVDPDTLSSTTSVCASDNAVGGACTTLVIHNRSDNLLTRLSAAVYLSDYYLARSSPSSFGANECQSGPCALFRASAIAPILLRWYTQTVWGKWMRVNEDRHLTTLLLRQGYNVLYAADSIAATESPPTLRRWLLQQVRWARAVHVESFYAPGIYVLQHPVLFFNTVRREIGGILIPLTIAIYALTGRTARPVPGQDLVQRLLITCGYLALRNPYRPSRWAEWLWLLPGQVLYNISIQGIQFWALMTMLDGSWGTCMRGSAEVQADATGVSSVDSAGSGSLQSSLESGLLTQPVSEEKRSRVKLRAQEIGFFVLWIGLVIGAIGRVWATTWYGFGGSMATLVAFACMVPTWMGMSWWMVAVAN
ncbi:hypothetical protein JX266_009982 [Neoarthrinium moseri]|nr:hypothetical protein JX266_009982 [Neoarthrinium moseri]